MERTYALATRLAALKSGDVDIIDRVAPLPLDTALDYAGQIADAPYAIMSGVS